MAEITMLTKLALRERKDPLLDFKWYSEVLPFNLDPTYLESIDIPFNNIKVGDGIYASSGYTYYPGAHDIQGFSATFYEDSAATTLNWILDWKARIKSFGTGFYQLPSNYKKDWTITLLNTRNEPVQDVKLIGVWPSTTSNLALNYTSNGRLVITQEFSIDDQQWIPYGYTA